MTFLARPYIENGSVLMINTPERKKSQGRADSGPASPRPRNHVVRHVNLDLFTLKDIPDIDLEIVLECLKEGEYGDARLFAELFTGRCIYDHTDQLWYIWQGHFWKVDDTQMVKHLVSGVLASTYLKAVAEMNLRIARVEAQGSEEDEERAARLKQYKNTVKELNTRVHALKFVARMKNVLSNAQAFLPINADKWDTDRWALGTQAGVLDLKTGKLRPGQPSDYIRTIIPTTWKSLTEPCPRFEKFWHEIFADRSQEERADLIAFLQRFLGYAITGLTREHLVLLLFGDEGRNGKDTLIARLHKVLGGVSTIANKDIMVNPGRISAPGACKPHLAFLQGKRIAVVSETDRGERFSAAQVKELSGGGDINARRPHGQEFTFSPSHTLVLLTNNKPHADASDAAFWQRLCPVVFNMRFIDKPDPLKPNERKADTSLGDELDKEASGILAWLVRGCMEWQRIGMDIPQCIVKERASYREEEDTLGTFLRETCVTGNALSGKPCTVEGKPLYAAYSGWCEDNGINRPMNNNSFGAEISKRFLKKRLSSGVFYVGLGLRTEYQLEADAHDRKLLAEQEGQPASEVDQPGPASQGQPAGPEVLEEARARKLLKQFNDKGYTLTLKDERLAIGVPESMSEADFTVVCERVNALDAPLRKLLSETPPPDSQEVLPDGTELF